MNNIKKTTIISAALLAASVLPGAAQAEGFMVGTSAALLSVGAPNAYLQGKLGEESSYVLSYASLSNFSLSGGSISATAYSAAYKKYFSGYGKGGYWSLGAAQLSVSASTGGTFVSGQTATIPIITAGYEFTVGPVVVGAEGGLGTGGGLGVFGVNAAFQF